MNAAEVANALSFREFSRLCAVLDEKTKDGPAVSIGEDRWVSQRGRLLETKFKVIRIDREPDRVRILVDVGKGFGNGQWCELAA